MIVALTRRLIMSHAFIEPNASRGRRLDVQFNIGGLLFSTREKQKGNLVYSLFVVRSSGVVSLHSFASNPLTFVDGACFQ